MPDLFIDHFVSYPGDYRSFKRDLERVVRQGGGVILRVRQTIAKGGNAVNTALALSRLGGEAKLILRTDETGLALLRHFSRGENIILDHVKSDGRMAASTLLEFKIGRKVVNVMLGDQGSVIDFGPEFLTDEDFEAIRDADYVGVFNWSENSRCEELASKVFSYAKEHGRARTFFDPGDPSTRPRRIKSLFTNLLEKGLIDAIGLNENEFSWLFRYIRSGTRRGLKENLKFYRESIPLLFEKTGSRIDLHAASYALSYNGRSISFAPSFIVKPIRSTGAGDTWNAANMFGDSINLPPVQRLLFANAAAGLYISSLSPNPPTLKDVIVMMKSAKLKRTLI
ncbi:MAG: carbohydrate kinase family protein [Candidatus Bathyarchaeia archaeon]